MMLRRTIDVSLWRNSRVFSTSSSVTRGGVTWSLAEEGSVVDMEVEDSCVAVEIVLSDTLVLAACADAYVGGGVWALGGSLAMVL